jgi:RimJ/RimL family protein N-acetyltransferase
MLFPAETRDDVFWIETRRLWLRWPRLADVKSLAPWMGKPEVAAMTAVWPVGITPDAIAGRIAHARSGNMAGEKLILVVTERDATDIAIGQVGVSLEPSNSARLGYHLSPDHWGKGIMTEAVAALTDWTFILTRIADVTAGVRPENPASRRVLEKAGFAAVGRMTWDSPARGPIPIDSFRLVRGRPRALQQPVSLTLAPRQTAPSKAMADVS